MSKTLDQLPQNLLRKGRSRNCISVTLMIRRVRRDTCIKPRSCLIHADLLSQGWWSVISRGVAQVEVVGFARMGRHFQHFCFCLLKCASLNQKLLWLPLWITDMKNLRADPRTYIWLDQKVYVNKILNQRGIFPTETLCSLCLKVYNYVSIFEQYIACFLVSPGLNTMKPYGCSQQILTLHCDYLATSLLSPDLLTTPERS